MNSTASSLVLTAEHLTVAHGDRLLLDDVSIALHSGERVALIGPNGAGKSTFLKALSNEIKPDRGDIRLHGKSLGQWRDRDAARVRAVLPQSTSLNFSFTVREIVELGRFPHCAGALTRRDQDIVNEAMAATHVMTLSDRNVLTLSGGERARVHAARVLAQLWETHSSLSPVLLLDEPTAALDLRHQRELLQAVSAFVHRQNATVIAVLHDINLASQWADRIVWLHQGRVIANGSPSLTVDSSRIREVYEIDAAISQLHKSQRPFALIEMV